MMAGFSLCISDLLALTRRYQMEQQVGYFYEYAIADCINAFTPELINQMKRQLLEVARELSREVEQQHLLALCAGLAP